MEENNIENEIYNLSKENLTVKNIALVCKKINPNLKIKITNDKIPNPGYSLSNKKLLKSGFKFLYNFENSAEEMITKWSSNLSTPLEYIKKGEKL